MQHKVRLQFIKSAVQSVSLVTFLLELTCLFVSQAMSLHVLEFHTESLSSSYVMTEFDVILTVYQSSGI